MSYLSDYANNVSNILMRQGEQQSAAIAQRGQAQQQLIGGIGSAIAGIPGNIAALKDAEAKRAAMVQEGELRAGELNAQRRAAAADERAQQDIKSMDAASAASTGPDGKWDYNKLASLLPGHMRAGVMKSAADYEKSMADAAKTKADIDKLNDDHQLHLTNAVGNLALGVKAHATEGPEAMRGAFIMGLSKAMNDGLIQKTEAQQLINATNLDPTKLPALLDDLIAKSPSAMENQLKQTQAAEASARIPGIQAQGTINAAVAAGMVNGLTPAEQATKVNEEARIALEKTRVALEGRRVEMAERALQIKGGANITPEDVAYWARQYQADPALAEKGMTGIPGLKAQVTKVLASSGVDLQQLDANGKRMKQTATTILPKIDTVADLARQINDLGLMGSVGGRWRGIVGRESGAADIANLTPDQRKLVGRFQTEVGLLNSAVAMAHGGQRAGASVPMLEAMDHLFGAKDKDLQTYLGALSGVRDFMQTYADMGGGSDKGATEMEWQTINGVRKLVPVIKK